MRTVLKTWHGFRRRKTSEKKIVAEAAVLLAVTWVGLRLAGFRRWKNWSEHLHPTAVAPAVDIFRGSSPKCLLDVAASFARLVGATARHFPVRTNCLENSFALYWLLRRHQIPATLRMGARKTNDRFEAHAWVETGGVILGDASGDQLPFVPFHGRDPSMESQTH